MQLMSFSCWMMMTHSFRILLFTNIIDARREKTDLKAFVVVIPKEGLVGGARHSLFGYDTDYRI